MADIRADFEADAELFSDLLGWIDNITLFAAESLVVVLLLTLWAK